MARRGRDANGGGWASYVALAFAISWVIWTPAVLATLGIVNLPVPLDALTPISIFVGAFGPLAAALALTRGSKPNDPNRGSRAGLLRRGLQWRTVPLRAWAVIAGLPFVANGVARSLDAATGGSPPPVSIGSVPGLVAVFFAILLLGGPVQEEFGWRGYALPRLVNRFGPVSATLLLGSIWTTWHLPFWFMEGSGMDGTPLPVYFLYTLGLTAVMTWLHLTTRASVLAAILMHATANWISNVLPTHGPETVDSKAYLYQAVIYLLVGAALLVRRAATRPARPGPVPALTDRESA